MAKTKQADRHSVFDGTNLSEIVDALKQEVRELYLEDDIPWVIGYSGGKDSTAVLQVIWMAIAELPPAQREKEIHVISTDTLVENPIVASWVSHSLEVMRDAAEKESLPIIPHRLTPEVGNSFWVNLIGKGYPAPRHKFRWCTERLKIMPSNKFIQETVRNSGEALLVLGTQRRLESSTRAHTMKKYREGSYRERLSTNNSLPNTFVYTPIEDWTNDDVWTFLMKFKNPWGFTNKDLLGMYQGATQDGECPLVVDTTTPSCGSSRFGCWVCTLVDKDKSMSAMIQNDEEKEWMLPLKNFRDKFLDFRLMDPEKGDRGLRDFRRMAGHVQMYNERPIPGPYKQDARANLLKELLKAQQWIRKNGPDQVDKIELISLEELREIRRIWVMDKHEIEDILPQVYEEFTGEEYPAGRLDDSLPFGSEEMELLKELCGEDLLSYELIRELIDVERRYRTKVKRAGLFDDLERAFRRSFYEDEEDAVGFARRQDEAKQFAKDQKELKFERKEILSKEEHQESQESAWSDA